MSKRLFISVTVLLLSVVLYLISAFMQPVVSGLNLNKPNVESFIRQIERRLAQNEASTNELFSSIDGKTAEEVFAYGVRAHHRYFDGSDVEMMIFRGDSLLFWSANIDFMPDTANVKVRIIKKDCDYFLSQCVGRSSFKFIFLTKIYVEFPYQNKFLVDGFGAEFSDIKGYRVSQELAYGAIPVRAEGVEQFFLVPIDSFQQKSYSVYRFVIQWFSIIMFAVGTFLLFGIQYFRKKPLLRFSSLSLVLIGLRAISLIFNIPKYSGGLLFGPELFAHTVLNPSLGDFFVNSVLLFVLVVLFYRLAVDYALHRKFAVLMALFVWAYFAIVDDAFVSLVMNSTLQFETYRIFSINIYSAIAYLAIAIVFCGQLLFVYTWFVAFYDDHRFKSTCKILLLTFFLYCVERMVFNGESTSVYGLVLAFLIVALFVVKFRWFRTSSLTLGWLSIFIIALSIYSVAIVSNIANQKDANIRKVLAINLSSERDPLAELLLRQVSQRLYSDALVRHYVRNVDTYNTELYDYLRKDYFRDYLNKYDLRATVCLQNLVDGPESGNDNYNAYFTDLIQNHGAIIPLSRFFYLNVQNGIISYIGVIKYRYGNDIRNLYIELNSRPSWEMLGYPELLVEGQNSQRKLYGYSYAKYHKGKLVNQGGSFPYSLNFRPNTSSQNFNQGGYNHIVYNHSVDDATIVSSKVEEPLNTTATFVYNLVFFVLIISLLLKISGIPVSIVLNRHSFKSRVKWAIGLIVVMSMLLVATATIIYSVKNFEERNQKTLGEKLMSVTLELYQDIPLFTCIEENRDLLTNRLIDLSNVFYSDINIYDTTGMLVITSRPEIFDRDLMGERMNYKAWNEIYYKNSPKFVERESIGGANFLSAYVPIIDDSNEPIAYLNLPYFTKEEELKDELYSIVIAIINIYALLLLLAVIIAMAISSQIMRPLELIREKIRMVNITSRNDLIVYKGKDEVGQLIGEYNRMVQELDKSARELAKNQREGAWREMARQVAHEIKNPLTPIKLSLQYLVKAKKEGVPDWDERFARFAQSLDEQINTLSRIASEFSSFAKLPMAKIDELSIWNIINDVVAVFAGYNDGEIKLHLENELIVEPRIRADKDQITRVFNNLVLNAVQSIDRGKPGDVAVRIFNKNEDVVRVEVIDNGSGITAEVLPKLFNPNFTTKSSGTGLGLAISREIVETFGGRIGAQNNEQQGATFWVEFPVVKSE